MLLKLSTSHRLLSPLKAFRSTRRAQQVSIAAQTSRSLSGGQTVPELISSTSNSFVKHCCKLRTDSSYRTSKGSVLVVGVTPLLELAQELQDIEIKTLLWSATDRQPPTELKPSRLLNVTDSVMRKISGVRSAEGLVAAAEIQLPSTKTDFCSASFPTLRRLLVMDGIQDPGNIGTLLRTALALGWQGAFLLPGCCDPFNEKALRASRGAAFKLPLASGEWRDLERVLSHHNMACLAAQPEGKAEAEAEASDGTPGKLREVALVLGSEGQGLSPIVQQHCTSISLPMKGPMESLSVSQAGAILLFVLSGSLPELVQKLNGAQLNLAGSTRDTAAT